MMGAPLSVMSCSIAGIWEIIFCSESRQKVNGYWKCKWIDDLIWKQRAGRICIDRAMILMNDVDCCHWSSWFPLTCKWIAAMRLWSGWYERLWLVFDMLRSEYRCIVEWSCLFALVDGRLLWMCRCTWSVYVYVQSRGWVQEPRALWNVWKTLFLAQLEVYTSYLFSVIDTDSNTLSSNTKRTCCHTQSL